MLKKDGNSSYGNLSILACRKISFRFSTSRSVIPRSKTVIGEPGSNDSMLPRRFTRLFAWLVSEAVTNATGCEFFRKKVGVAWIKLR
jgi:hypothetical protein